MLKVLIKISILTFVIIFLSASIDYQAIASPDPHWPEWQFECQRENLAPVYKVDRNVYYQGNPTLLLAGGGKDFANGHFSTIEKVEPGKHYQFRVYFKSESVEEPNRCILARILWNDHDGNQIGRAEYPRTLLHKNPEGWNIIEQVYRVPENSKTAKIELVYRWDADGEVRFGGYSFAESDHLQPRKVKLATIHHRPQNSKGPQENLAEYASYIKEAAAEGADIVCLPEGMTVVGTQLDYISASEAVPGPSTDFLGNLARELGIYIVAGIFEMKKGIVYNTAILIDRNGDLAGKYHKLSLPREEIQGGITPGNKIPVFDTDFGRIGMMICWDVTFPETARALAKQGAEVIFLPIWGGDLILTRARAIENQVYMVSSSYDMKTAVFDKEGKILAEATVNDPVIVVEVDLSEQKLWPWLVDMKNRIPREMPPGEAVDVIKF